MINSKIASDRPRRELRVTDDFLESPNDESFTEVFLVFTPQLVSFFRSHGCGPDLSEDLSQEVMLTVYRKSRQIRDRTRFRSWLFTIGATRFTGIAESNGPKRTGLIWKT